MDELVKKSKQWGLKNRKSGNPMTKSQFASVLQNPFYYGVMFYNKTFFLISMRSLFLKSFLTNAQK